MAFNTHYNNLIFPGFSENIPEESTVKETEGEAAEEVTEEVTEGPAVIATEGTTEEGEDSLPE